ncbi:MAG: helix-turn-helix domain-containing protein [Candidatus Bathyarchaeota archaeon]|nr:helix-turn-helix domain-containing protein [Candidatus Bathyarchaeota archaeon]
MVTQIRLTPQGKAIGERCHQLAETTQHWEAVRPFCITSWEEDTWTTSCTLLAYLSGAADLDSPPPVFHIDSLPHELSLFERALRTLNLASWRFDAEYYEIAMCFEQMCRGGLIADIEVIWPERSQRVLDMTAALASKPRQKLLRYLREEEPLTMPELTDRMALDRSTVAKHMKILGRSRLTTFRKVRREVEYLINRWAFCFLMESLSRMAGINEPT